MNSNITVTHWMQYQWGDGEVDYYMRLTDGSWIGKKDDQGIDFYPGYHRAPSQKEEDYFIFTIIPEVREILEAVYKERGHKWECMYSDDRIAMLICFKEQGSCIIKKVLEEEKAMYTMPGLMNNQDYRDIVNAGWGRDKQMVLYRIDPMKRDRSS